MLMPVHAPQEPPPSSQQSRQHQFFHEVLQTRRETLGLTQEDAAARLHLTLAEYQDRENDKVEVTFPERWGMLTLLGVPLAEARELAARFPSTLLYSQLRRGLLPSSLILFAWPCALLLEGPFWEKGTPALDTTLQITITSMAFLLVNMYLQAFFHGTTGLSRRQLRKYGTGPPPYFSPALHQWRSARELSRYEAADAMQLSTLTCTLQEDHWPATRPMRLGMLLALGMELTEARRVAALPDARSGPRRLQPYVQAVPSTGWFVIAVVLLLTRIFPPAVPFWADFTLSLITVVALNAFLLSRFAASSLVDVSIFPIRRDVPSQSKSAMSSEKVNWSHSTPWVEEASPLWTRHPEDVPPTEDEFEGAIVKLEASLDARAAKDEHGYNATGYYRGDFFGDRTQHLYLHHPSLLTGDLIGDVQATLSSIGEPQWRVVVFPSSQLDDVVIIYRDVVARSHDDLKP